MEDEKRHKRKVLAELGLLAVRVLLTLAEIIHGGNGLS